MKRDKRSKNKKYKSWLRYLVFVSIVSYVVFSLVVPLPAYQIVAEKFDAPIASAINMKWPSYGQAAVGAVGYGILDQHGDQKPLPMASVAKVLTATAILKAHPLALGQAGEKITMTKADVALYDSYVTEGQSVIPVEAGEQLTEYQALQAILLPSANNIAESAVKWAFGSTENFLSFVNPFAKTLGMINTQMMDASGYSPKTTSTAVDLTKLAEIAMNQPVLAEIISQAQANLPVVGTVYNVNFLLGKNGVVGIKTGNTDEAGGCFQFAAKRKLNDKYPVTVVGTIMGAPDLKTALNSSVDLIDQTYANFSVKNIFKANQTIAVLTRKNGEKIEAKISSDITSVFWKSQSPQIQTSFKQTNNSYMSGENVGTLKIFNGNMTNEYPIVSTKSSAKYSRNWRIQHAGGYL